MYLIHSEDKSMSKVFSSAEELNAYVASVPKVTVKAMVTVEQGEMLVPVGTIETVFVPREVPKAAPVAPPVQTQLEPTEDDEPVEIYNLTGLEQV